ncbi:MAG: hypothetical protein M5U23_04465 [Acidimicrobiia bacterium]|nr:hypothetical protein [Acidimicrobiia bacterium]
MTQAFQFDTAEPFFAGQVLQIEEFTWIVDKATNRTINAAVVLMGTGARTSIVVIPEHAYKTNCSRGRKKA